jgi:iron complex outermembrane receptor protein
MSLASRVASLALFSAGPLFAQEGSLRGTVTDSAGAPLNETAVTIVALHQATRTDDRGRFTFNKLPVGDVELTVRRIGYEPRAVRAIITAAAYDSVAIKLNELPEVLSAISVSATERRLRQGIEEFYWRRARGIGKFITRDDILDRHARVTTDMVRAIPGVQVVRTRDGLGLRFTSGSNGRPCSPTIWLDGQRSLTMELDEVPVNDIEGIELYQSLSITPPQFWQGNSTSCGAIAIWTRSPTPIGPRPNDR